MARGSTPIGIGTPREPNEGLRIGTVRRPPRGVPRAEFAPRDYYDAWLPDVAPSEALVKAAQEVQTDREWLAFVRRYRAEMKAPAIARLLDLLAALSHVTDLSVGCYCADERQCHRSVLRELLRERGARMADDP